MKRVFLLAGVLLAALIFSVANGAGFSQNQKKEQESSGAAAKGQLTGDLVYVDSSNGNDANSGDSPRHALLTLTRAVAVADAGDTIILNPGGSETVTSAITVSDSKVKIICPVKNPHNGFTVTGAGTLDLLSISGTDIHIEGLKLTHTGTIANQACIYAAATADRLCVKNCIFDDSAVTVTFTGYGVELTDACDNVIIDSCLSKECKYGVNLAPGSSKVLNNTVISNCTFWVGKSAAFGIYSNAAGNCRGTQVTGCVFIESLSSGASTDNAWDGTGTTATQGPIYFDADTDQFVIASCVGYTALAQSFDTILALISGATGDVVNCFTGEGGDLEDKVNTLTTNLAAWQVIGLANAATIVGYVDTLEASGLANAATILTAVELGDTNQLANAATILTAVELGDTNQLANAATIVTAVELGDTNQLANAATIKNLCSVYECSFEADVDISEADYTGWVGIFTLTAPAGGITDLVVYIDLNKATTGWDEISTAADTLDSVYAVKIDGTNYRGVEACSQRTATGNATQDLSTSGILYKVGALSAASVLQVYVKLSVERDDFELPCRIICEGGQPVIVPVAIP